MTLGGEKEEEKTSGFGYKLFDCPQGLAPAQIQGWKAEIQDEIKAALHHRYTFFSP